MLNKKKKSVRMRGHHTHGYGSKKKHRGSGHQGGVGLAGTGKRADQKKPSIWKEKYFGRYGFKSIKKNQNHLKTINLFYIEEHFDLMLADGRIKKEGDFYTIDLAAQGFDKLLGSGTATRKYKITVGAASESAIAKVSEKQGVVSNKD